MRSHGSTFVGRGPGDGLRVSSRLERERSINASATSARV
jgi:hypothetical protein